MGILGKTLTAVMLCMLPFVFTSPAYAADVDVTVTIAKILEVEYTGNPQIIFIVGLKELNEGSMQLVNQGNINWWSNTAPWNITIQRTLWDTKDGDQNLELWLEAHYGPPPPPPPPPPDFFEVTTKPQVWIHGTTTGSGTILAVDWKIKKLDWTMTPGTYTCIVTILMVAA